MSISGFVSSIGTEPRYAFRSAISLTVPKIGRGKSKFGPPVTRLDENLLFSIFRRKERRFSLFRSVVSFRLSILNQDMY